MSAAVVVVGALVLAVWGVHGFYVGCENGSPFSTAAPGPNCFDPIGYNNHLPFRLAIVGLGLLAASVIILLGRVLTKPDHTS